MSETPPPAPQTQSLQTTAPGDPGDPANPSQTGSRLTIISVTQGIIAVFVVAILVWMWPWPAITNAKHNLDLSIDPDMTVMPGAGPAPIPIAWVTSASGIRDGWDHPELAGLATDEEPETSWRTASMRDATLVGGHDYGLVTNLGETPVRVCKVVVTFSAHGGQPELCQPADGQPANNQPAGGTLLGALPLSNTMAFNLGTPVLTKQLVLWSTNPPTTSDGGSRLMVSEVQVLGQGRNKFVPERIGGIVLYDVIITGSGSAGYTATVYTSRIVPKILIVVGLMDYGGILTSMTLVESHPGFEDDI